MNCSIGDICPSDKLLIVVGVLLNMTKKCGENFPIDRVQDALKGFDLILGNFEGILPKQATKKNTKQLTFCMDILISKGYWPM